MTVPPASRDLRVVVEDQPLFRQMLSMLISAADGFMVAGEFESAAATVDLDARTVDVALVDLRLGDGDGLTVGRRLRQRNPRLGALLLSASDSTHVLLDIPQSEAHGWGYLSKTSSLSAPALLYAIRAVAEAGRCSTPRSAPAGRCVGRAPSPLSAPASARYWDSSPRDTPTPRSPASWGCRPGPSTRI